MIRPGKITIAWTVFLVAAVWAAPGRSGDKFQKIRFGVTTEPLDRNPAEVLNAVRPFAQLLGRRSGFEQEVEVVTSREEVSRRFKDHSLDMAVVSEVDYIRLQKEMGVRPLVRPVKGGRDTVSGVLLVRKDGGIDRVEDLKGRRFAQVFNRSDLTHFLGKIIFKRHGVLGTDSFFGGVEEVSKAASSIYSVFMKKADACVVTDLLFDLMADLNPQIKNDLKILVQTESVANAPIFVRKDLPDDMGFKIKKTLLETTEVPEGKQLLMIFKFSRMVEAKDADYDSLRNMLKELGQL